MILDIVNKPAPVKLYHYTDLSSLVGIISCEEFWMSNLFYQNDKDEYEIGLNNFRAVLEKIKKKYSSDKKITIFLNSLDSALELLSRQSVYTLSLSEEPDLISQWRGYADNCKGVRIELSDFSKMKEPGVQLLPCLYNSEDHEKYVEELVNKAVDIFSKTNETGVTKKSDFSGSERTYSDAIQAAGSFFISTANVACGIIKSNCFSEEKEWRLIKFRPNEIYFRSRPNLIVPYIKKHIPNFKNILTDVMICSAAEKDSLRRSIRFMLDEKGFRETTVSDSNIPYRL